MQTSQQRPRLGIMTCHLFSEEGFFRFLSQAGRQMGIDVYVFRPHDYMYPQGKVKAIVWSSNRWKKMLVPQPHLIYDRCFYPNSQVYAQLKPFIQQLKNQGAIQFLGHGLHGKVQLYTLLSKHEQLRRFLPPTETFSLSHVKLLRRWLQRYPAVILKPSGGSLGKRIIRIQRTKQQYRIDGRNRSNQFFQLQFQYETALLKWLKQFMQASPFIIQPFLPLQTANQLPFDCRLLLQKNKAGEWQLTGKAIRVGKQGQLTSNLHGGGTAFPSERFFAKHYSRKQRMEIEEQIETIIRYLPDYLEEQHGRLVELGIDLGIEPSGRVWIIEANSKPGRRVFSIIGDKRTSQQAHLQPLYYAKHLLTINKEVKN